MAQNDTQNLLPINNSGQRKTSTEQDKNEQVPLIGKIDATSSDLINKFIFGRFQITLFAVTFLGYFGVYGSMQLTIYLSTRLYVEMGLTPTIESLLSVCSYTGFAVGFPVVGVLADKIGRKNTIVISFCWIAFWNCMCALSPDIKWLLIFRTGYSLAATGVYSLILIYFYEILAARHRWIAYLVMFHGGACLGHWFDIILAYFLFTNGASKHAWRYYIVAITLSVALFIPLALTLLKESPRYLLTKGHTKKALQVIQEIAKQNHENIPQNVSLVLESEIGNSNDEKMSILAKIKTALSNWQILQAATGIVMIGIACMFIFFAVGLMKTELLYLNRKRGTDSCTGADQKLYFLQERDYIALLFFQIIADGSAAFGMIIAFKLDITFKMLSVFCMGAAVVLVCFLYLCPDIWIALLILSLIQSMGLIVNMIQLLKLSGIFPTNVRSTLMGVCKFLMYLPLPMSPYLVQTLAKESQHYVTSVCVVFLSVGFAGAVFLPKEIHAN
ncbi:synaptic vesicle 2-related protein-like isoform X2 [Convolutriloba macropyga]